MIDQSAIATETYPGKNIETFFDWLPVTKSIVQTAISDTHIILVRIVRCIQNSCIKYSTQNQHFAKMFTYSDNTSYNLNFYYLLVQFN
jgi:hypothetical protein